MGGGKLASAAGINYLVGDGGGRDIIFIRGDSTVLQGRAMSQARNGSPTKWIGDCSLCGAQRNRNRRHKKERRTGAAKQNYLGSSRTSPLVSWGIGWFGDSFCLRVILPVSLSGIKPFQCSINSSLSFFLSYKKGVWWWCVKESPRSMQIPPSVTCHISLLPLYLCLLCTEYKVAYSQTRLCKNKDIECKFYGVYLLRDIKP